MQRASQSQPATSPGLAQACPAGGAPAGGSREPLSTSAATQVGQDRDLHTRGDSVTGGGRPLEEEPRQAGGKAAAPAVTGLARVMGHSSQPDTSPLQGLVPSADLAGGPGRPGDGKDICWRPGKPGSCPGHDSEAPNLLRSQGMPGEMSAL